MSDDKKQESAISKIFIAVAVALLAGGTAPWWWEEFIRNGKPVVSSPTPQPVDEVTSLDPPNAASPSISDTSSQQPDSSNSPISQIPSPDQFPGDLYAYDGFDYTLGSALQGLDGGIGWSGSWRTTNVGPANGGTIVAGLSYTDDAGTMLPVTGGALATDPSLYYSQEVRNSLQNFGSAGESVWLSFLVKQSEEPLNGVNYAESTIGTGFTRGSNAMLGGISGGDVAVNPYFVTNTPEYTLRGIAQAGSIYLIVLRFDFAPSGNDTINLWVNPRLGNDPGSPRLSGTLRNYADPISGITLAHGDYRTFIYDEVRIGSSYAAVVGASLQ